MQNRKVEKKIQQATVIGAGVMGHGIAQFLACNGLKVTLVDNSDSNLAQAKKWIDDNLKVMVDLGEIKETEISSLLSRIVFTTELSESIKGSKYVLEAITENLEIKKKIWKIMGEYSDDDAILASNTSSYDINELGKGVPNEERIIGTHWFHPPPITPCVEVIPSEKTSDRTTQFIVSFLKDIGKIPTKCKSEPGFVANRLQMALAAEAINLVEKGLATPNEVDQIVKTSFGFRLSAYGPFEIIDQAGADTYLSIFEYLYEKLGEKHFKPPRFLTDQVEAGLLGLKVSKGFYDYTEGAADSVRRNRDRKLYARLRLFREEVRN